MSTSNRSTKTTRFVLLKKTDVNLYIFFSVGDDPKESLPNYVYTEQATTADSSTHVENENGSLNETENPMDVSNKNPTNITDQSDVQQETSMISTRNSAKRNKGHHQNQRSTLTRRQVKEKEAVNGHNEVKYITQFNIIPMYHPFPRKRFFLLKTQVP